MFIKQFKYSTDNLGYLAYSRKEGIAIDAGSVDDILSFAEKNNIHIKYVTNTHSHYDHTPGNQALLEKTNAQFIDCRKIKSDRAIALDMEIIEAYHTPGHTDDSITFAADDFLVTGDTLFNGTIGNCFSGDLEAFFKSLKRLIALPGNTKIYAGHDYVIEAIKMAKIIEKDNPNFEAYIQKYNSGLIVSTLDDELSVNPYIRFNAQRMIHNLNKRNMPANTEFDRFKSIMEIY
ncbi:MBL fold metallo-hydrolase [Desulfobacula phenolica]|uniref:Hydroxyacylglutathione hydrolase n=1 Tax=Desulfobacula phenolica TaxID=90732 RepID=A0A1H2G8Q3_9BACT|nr:MBL fold metallo-hydrolase [Desulfobacula phenolica]SDU16003.1 hydroxyacylglutathione hydrolase [Desulfobacula phenolica]